MSDTDVIFALLEPEDAYSHTGHSPIYCCMYRRCTLGEISSALEESWGRHRPSTAVVRGAYSASFDGPDKVRFGFTLIQELGFCPRYPG